MLQSETKKKAQFRNTQHYAISITGLKRKKENKLFISTEHSTQKVGSTHYKIKSYLLVMTISTYAGQIVDVENIRKEPHLLKL